MTRNDIFKGALRIIGHIGDGDNVEAVDNEVCVASFKLFLDRLPVGGNLASLKANSDPGANTEYLDDWGQALKVGLANEIMLEFDVSLQRQNRIEERWHRDMLPYLLDKDVGNGVVELYIEE